MWRVITGRHHNIEFFSMEAGHTKFNPDWHFGLWKMKWRHSTAETLEDVVSSVCRYSRNGHNFSSSDRFTAFLMLKTYLWHLEQRSVAGFIIKICGVCSVKIVLNSDKLNVLK